MKKFHMNLRKLLINHRAKGGRQGVDATPRMRIFSLRILFLSPISF